MDPNGGTISWLIQMGLSQIGYPISSRGLSTLSPKPHLGINPLSLDKPDIGCIITKLSCYILKKTSRFSAHLLKFVGLFVLPSGKLANIATENCPFIDNLLILDEDVPSFFQS